MNTYNGTPAWSSAEPQLDVVLARFNIPASFSIQAWSPNYFDAMCALSSAEGWTTPELRPKETLAAWENSWPTLVAMDTNGRLVGFLRAITDTQIWKVYLFCEERNQEARRFYEAKEFRLETFLKDFYPDGDAIMYSKILKF